MRGYLDPVKRTSEQDKSDKQNKSNDENKNELDNTGNNFQKKKKIVNENDEKKQ